MNRRRAAFITVLASGGVPDVIAPTLAITMSDYTLTAGDAPTVTFTFSEEVLNFTADDITAPNGVLSGLAVTVDPTVYTATFTPTANVSDATNVITVGTNWTDEAGNPPAGATTSDNYTVNTIEYFWNDEFLDDVSAGLIDKHAANPGPGTWYAVDANSKLTQASGKLTFATGGSAEGNPGVWLPLTAREAGRVVVWEVTLPDTAADHASIGLDITQAGAIQDAVKFANTGLIRVLVGATTAFTIGLYTATAYYIAAVIRGEGVFWFIKGGTFTKWALIWKSNVTTAGVYPSIQAAGVSSVFTSDFIRSPETLWTTIPVLASDSFNRADGAAGNTDGAGIAEAGGSGIAWSGGAISGNALILNPTPGAEMHTSANAASDPNSNEADATTGWTVNGGNLTSDSSAPQAGTYNIRHTTTGNFQRLQFPFTGVVGQWYLVDFYIKATPASIFGMQIWSNLVPVPAITIPDTWTRFQMVVRATNTSCVLYFYPTNGTGNIVEIDSLSLKPLPFAECISVLETSKADVFVETELTDGSAYYGAGIIARCDSSSNPQNFVLCRITGHNKIAVDECVSGVYTNILADAVKAFTTGDKLFLRLEGSAVRVYHLSVAGGGGATLVGTATTNVLTGTLHGRFATNSDKINSINILPAGSGDEFITLDAYLETPVRNSKWSELRAMPAIRADNTMAVYNGKFYSFGGYTPQTPASTPHADTYEYDPATDLWTAKTDMPTARWGMVAVTVGDKIHVFGGQVTPLGTLVHEIFDPVANTWDVTKDDMPAGLADQGLMAVLYGTKIHLFYKNAHYEYNPADDTYTAKANVPVSVSWGTCAVVGTKIYVIGGYSYDDPINATDVNQIYDTVANTWSSGAVMPDKLYGQTRENPVINGLIYCTHGQDEDSLYYTTVHIYNPATDSWTTDSDSAVYPRDGVGCVVLNNVLYVTGGRAGSVQYAWHEKYTP